MHEQQLWSGSRGTVIDLSIVRCMRNHFALLSVWQVRKEWALSVFYTLHQQSVNAGVCYTGGPVWLDVLTDPNRRFL